MRPATSIQRLIDTVVVHEDGRTIANGDPITQGDEAVSCRIEATLWAYPWIAILGELIRDVDAEPGQVAGI